MYSQVLLKIVTATICDGQAVLDLKSKPKFMLACCFNRPCLTLLPFFSSSIPTRPRKVMLVLTFVSVSFRKAYSRTLKESIQFYLTFPLVYHW